MRTNVGSRASAAAGKTHEGAPAALASAEQELRRSMLTCLLWEDTFYEKGSAIAARIAELVPQVAPEAAAQIALDARGRMHLRHAPLFLAREMARHPEHRKFVRRTLAQVVQRPDELAEFVSMYWPGGDKRAKGADKMAKSAQRGLADAFKKFGPYALAKYNRDAPVKLRDVLFLSHPKPGSGEQAETWKKLVGGTLEPPDTWEVALSAGADKKATWERLIAEKKLGGLALIRNLRNMAEAKVDDEAVRQALRDMRPDKILPFRFIAAVRHAPRFAPELEAAMLKNLEGAEQISGSTVVLVDVSGSMDGRLSDKSEITRIEAAAGLAMLAREVSASCRVFAFSDHLAEVPAYRGLGLIKAISDSMPHSGTYLGGAVERLNREAYDRLIVVTDEQSADRVPGPKGRGYMVNVAAYKHGVGYGPWVHIDGWSDYVIQFVHAYEHELAQRAE